MADEQKVVDRTRIRDDKPHASKSQTLKRMDFPAKVVDRVLDENAMFFQEAIEIVSGLKPQQPPELGLRDFAALVLFQGEALKRPARQVIAAGAEAPGKIVRDLHGHIHGVSTSSYQR